MRKDLQLIAGLTCLATVCSCASRQTGLVEERQWLGLTRDYKKLWGEMSSDQSARPLPRYLKLQKRLATLDVPESAIKDYLQSTNNCHRTAALTLLSLRSFDDPSILESLLGFLNDDESYNRLLTARALGEVAVRLTDAQLDEVSNALLKEPDDLVSFTLLKIFELKEELFSARS